METLTTRIRWMLRRDLPEVLRIEELSTLYPWTETDFLRHLRHDKAIGFVVEYQECVIGFMIYEMLKASYCIHNFAVHPNFRRQNVGSKMVNKLHTKLSDKRTRLTIEVRETNLPAQLFLRAVGFRAVHVIKSFYEDSGEDAYFMVSRSGQC